PRVEKVGDKTVTIAREVVRINHHRNCLLCHAPAEKDKTPKDTLVAQVPLPSEPLTAPYYGSPPKPTGLMVRIDVTYLRQDFSVMQPVYDSSAWPVMQRFDYVVRKRVLTADQASKLRKRLKDQSPHWLAADKALRKLKGDS